MKIILRCQFRFRKKTHDRFPTLNEYIDCERGSTIAAAAMKKKCTEQVKEQCLSQQIESVKGKVDLLFEWHSSTRHDPDNVAFAKKFILERSILNLIGCTQKLKALLLADTMI